MTEEESKKTPFFFRTFFDFCALVGRLFYDDQCVILIDFLVKEQRAYTEADIREKLKWKDTILHQKLFFLERQLIFQRERNLDKGTKSPVFWRISPNIVYAVEWHYAKLISNLDDKLESSRSLEEFICLSCNQKFSALDAASCQLAVEDEHPLCKKCGCKLTTSNSETEKIELKKLQERALDQLSILRSSLDRVRNMEIPVFETYTRADKNEERREQEEKLKVQSTKPNDEVKEVKQIQEFMKPLDTDEVIPWMKKKLVTTQSVINNNAIVKKEVIKQPLNKDGLLDLNTLAMMTNKKTKL